MRIVFTYAACLALLFVALSVRTLRLRKRLGIAVGDRGNEVLLRAMRVHANFAEYVPLALLLLAWVEAGSATRTLPVALAVALAVGRCLHPVGLHRPSPNAFRAAGVVLTFCVIGVESVVLLVRALG